GAPYARATSPLTRIPAPTAGAVVRDGTRTSIAAVGSWTITRRFVASSKAAGVVTEPSIVCVPLPATMAAAIVITAPELPEPELDVGDGCGVVDGVGPPRRTRSAGPRSQIR